MELHIRYSRVLTSSRKTRPTGSCVLHQRHEAEIHVELHMAVKQSESRVIRNEIDFSALTTWNVDRVLANSRRGFSGDSR